MRARYRMRIGQEGPDQHTKVVQMLPNPVFRNGNTNGKAYSMSKGFESLTAVRHTSREASGSTQCHEYYIRLGDRVFVQGSKPIHRTKVDIEAYLTFSLWCSDRP